MFESEIFSLVHRVPYPECYRIVVRDIEVDCFLGVYPHEQLEKRPVVVNVEMYVPRNPRALDARLLSENHSALAMTETGVPGDSLNVVDSMDCALMLSSYDPPMAEDALSGTVNYESVLEIVERVASAKRFLLIETLCEALAGQISLLSGLRAFRVCVEKPKPLPKSKAVWVETWHEFPV